MEFQFEELRAIVYRRRLAELEKTNPPSSVKKPELATPQVQTARTVKASENIKQAELTTPQVLAKPSTTKPTESVKKVELTTPQVSYYGNLPIIKVAIASVCKCTVQTQS